MFVQNEAGSNQKHDHDEKTLNRKNDSFDLVRSLGLAMPDVEQGTAWGSPALKVRGQMFACMAIHRSAGPDTLVVRIDLDQRDGLIAEQPEIYYLTEHYVNYPCVLVRLGQIRQDALRDLLSMARQFVSKNKPRRSVKRAVRKRR